MEPSDNIFGIDVVAVLEELDDGVFFGLDGTVARSISNLLQPSKDIRKRQTSLLCNFSRFKEVSDVLLRLLSYLDNNSHIPLFMKSFSYLLGGLAASLCYGFEDDFMADVCFDGLVFWG